MSDIQERWCKNERERKNEFNRIKISEKCIVRFFVFELCLRYRSNQGECGERVAVCDADASDGQCRENGSLYDQDQPGRLRG